MKSAYELALEKMERQGIEPPREEKFSSEEREAMAEIRRRAEAKLAEMEILHRDSLDPQRPDLKAHENYRAERQRIEDKRDRDIRHLREARR